MSKKSIAIGAAALIIVVLIVLGITTSSSNSNKNNSLQVIAGENFWGSLVSQIGGNKVKVTSVVSDPNADPHEYETSNKDARAFATANYVILNGAGYDSWGDKLLGANPNSTRKELKVAELLGKKDGANPHFWYNPTYVNEATAQMEKDLSSLDPHDKTYFESQYKTLQKSLAGYQGQIAAIKQQYAGMPVAATEDIFVYLANAEDLNLISPPEFIEAVAEGNDPPTASVSQFEQQLQIGQPKILLYNLQTVTPLTDNMKKIAAGKNIPIVGMSETVQPPTASFQSWMGNQVTTLQNALRSTK